ncbi:unnamed protein product [Heligmosomoides polygyrus]|uniref:Secreted protein n=1 Tax=Heligmosomoides polygyrus TaxID=6339 RepID=A0A183FHV9_HELPZ|nr:unnamed protein product [Heligmosomoides polygyrus]
MQAPSAQDQNLTRVRALAGRFLSSASEAVAAAAASAALRSCSRVRHDEPVLAGASGRFCFCLFPSSSSTSVSSHSSRPSDPVLTGGTLDKLWPPPSSSSSIYMPLNRLSSPEIRR